MANRTKPRLRALPVLTLTGLLGLFISIASAQVDAPEEQRAREAQGQTPTDTDEQQSGTTQKEADQERSTQQPSDRKTRTDVPAPPQEQRTPQDRAERADQEQSTQARDNEKPADRNRTNGANAGQQRGRRDQQDQASDKASPSERGEGAASSGRRQSRIGIEFDTQADRPLTIARVEPNSRAAQAGLRSGDRIVSVDGRQIAAVRQLQAYVSGQQGRWVPLVIERGGNQYSIQLGPGPSSDEGAWLGVYLQDSEGQQGAQVTSVYPASPAARAGIRTGDVIVSANGQRITNAPDLIAAIEELEPRSRTELVIQRRDQELTIPVVLGQRDSYVTSYRGFDSGFGQGNEDDGDLASFPPYAMQLEHDRRNAEQHQRIESEIQKLREEIKQLRELIEQKK